MHANPQPVLSNFTDAPLGTTNTQIVGTGPSLEQGDVFHIVQQRPDGDVWAYALRLEHARLVRRVTAPPVTVKDARV